SASVQAGPGANGILSIQSHTHHHTWLDEEITSIRLMAGILAGVVGRHQAGEAIRDRDAIFARVFAAHPEGLVIFRLEDGTIIECNKGFCLIADFDSRENAIGSSLQSLSWITQPRAGESLWSRIEPVGNLEETEIQVKQGEAGALQLIVSAIPIDMANVPCGLMLLRDITKQRELEIQLRQAQKMEAVGLLAGGIAHNFNNMLTVISGFSEVLLDSVEDELRNDVKSIWEAAQRSSALTRQLLAFSRRQVLQTEIIDLGELVAEQEQMLAPLIGEDIIIQLNLSDTVMHVEVDRGQIEQVMMNLATNARDAMPNGGDLTFSTREVMLKDDLANSLGLSPDHFACIRVEDSGVGMAEEVIARAFEPFYTTKEKGAGSGLGLSTAHGIIEQSGGAISIQSELGHGTSIDVYLPLTDRAARKSNRLTAREQTLDHTETILLVEDEAEVRRLA
ncbi:ATP-binding protein, partial [Myxococcota bacterium]|nr:ATP-binding protein [Myxococcota bacterium]